MSNDTLNLIAVALATGITYYTLPKLIEVLFKRGESHVAIEKIQNELDETRWARTLEENDRLMTENKRLRTIIIRHGLDPNESGPLDAKPKHGFRND